MELESCGYLAAGLIQRATNERWWFSVFSAMPRGRIWAVANYDPAWFSFFVSAMLLVRSAVICSGTVLPMNGMIHQPLTPS